MRIRSYSQATLALRAFNFCPPDPAWAGKGELERTRAALRAYDRGLNLFWSPLRRFSSALPGRWRIVQFSQSGMWSTLHFWEGPNGEYRPPEADAVLAEAIRCDVSNRGHNTGTIAKAIDKREVEEETKKEQTQHDDALANSLDKMDYGYSEIAGRIIPEFQHRKNFMVTR